jgi:hypothetical protein
VSLMEDERRRRRGRAEPCAGEPCGRAQAEERQGMELRRSRGIRRRRPGAVGSALPRARLGFPAAAPCHGGGPQGREERERPPLLDAGARPAAEAGR